jgi:YVTN family beta-propeller protein
MSTAIFKMPAGLAGVSKKPAKTSSLRRLATACAIVLMAGAAAAIPQAAHATAGNVAIADIAIPAGKTASVPVRVVFTPDGTKAYATDEANDAVVVMNTATRQVTKTISLSSIGGIPTNLSVSPDGKKLYVLSLNPGSVAVIDTSSDELASANNGKVQGYKGDNPYGIAYATNQNLALVTNNDAQASVAIIDTSSDTQTGTVSGFPTDHGALGVAISSDNSLAYVAQATGVAVVQLSKGSGTYKQEVANYTGSTPLNIAFVPGDRYTAYVTNQNQVGSVSVIDDDNNNYRETGTVANFKGAFPANVAITPDGKTAYVTNYGSNSVSVIDVGSEAALTTVNMGKFQGKNPNGLALRVMPGNKNQTADLAYVANSGSSKVTVVQLPVAAVIGKIAPNSGPVYGGTKVTISGAHLTDTSAVIFGDTKATPESVTDTAVTVVAPSSAVLGPVNVQVENPGGNATQVNGFTYITARR